MGIRGIIFDMDGTITAPYLEFARFNTAAGIGKVDTLDYLRSATGAEYDRVHALLMQFEEGGVANAKLNRGARRLLNYLKKRGMPTALLTRNSRKSVAGVCRKLNLQFDLVFTREDGPHKPDPAPIRQIAQAWKMQRSELLMVGDYKWDILCAKNAGIACALLLDGEEVPEWAKGAEYIIRRLSEIVPILEGKRHDVAAVCDRRSSAALTKSALIERRYSTRTNK